MGWSRRQLLKGAALGAAGLAAVRPRVAQAWGAVPNATIGSLLLPEGERAEQVLEVFLSGGLSPWETLYTVLEHGRPSDPDYPREQYHLFSSDLRLIADRCGFAPGWATPEYFGRSGEGARVHLGPLMGPLRDRPDLVSRLRVLVQRHSLEPHEAAVPLALTGQRLGSPRMAGLGASVQRYFTEVDGPGAPLAFTLYPDDQIETANLRAASAVGMHPASARPLELRIGDGAEVAELLSARQELGLDTPSAQALLHHYTAQAQDRYSGLRARQLSDYAAAQATLEEAAALEVLLSPEEPFARTGVSCDSESFSQPATSLAMAVHLLTRPTRPARWVTVIDGGLEQSSGGGGYDVHTGHTADTAKNLLHTLTTLTSLINAPGESDPDKLDLDSTLIVLNTEFGRTPYLQRGSGNGTNHHPYGYTTALLGGPVRAAHQGVVGDIGPDGTARRYVTPAEARAAVLVALGIFPFAPGAFTLGDLRDGGPSEADGVAWLREIVLGRPA